MSSSVIILIFSFWPFRHIANPVEFLEEKLHTFHPSCKVSTVLHFKTVQWTWLRILTMDNGHMLHCVWLVVYYIVNDYTTITLCIQWMYSFIFKVSTAFLDGAVYLLLRLIHCSMWILCIQWGGEIIFVEFPISYLRRTKANSICDD